jgi:glutamate synthase domain-containing protein 3
MLLIGGDCGYMTGFMGQKGSIIVCGDAGEALGDSMYETVIFVGGSIQDLGNDAVVETPTAEDLRFLQETLAPHSLNADRDWKKVVSGRKMWNFDKHEDVWRAIL